MSSLSPATIGFVIVVLALLVYVITIYNKLIRGENLVEEAWSGIDVQLKRRHNLIPNIVETVKGYSKHEKELLENIVKIRNNVDNSSNVGERGESENALSKSIKSLFAVAEAYPDLKANENFLDLQKQLVVIEKDISLARRYYNGAVRALNILVESFPSSLVAKMTAKESADYFELEYATQRDAPEIKMT